MINSTIAQGFKTNQLKYERVREAYADKEKTLLGRYRKQGFKTLAQPIFIRAFKESGELELWAQNAKSKSFILIHTYTICTKSGTLGPKRKMGDYQVPEGFYTVSVFNHKLGCFPV